MLKKLTEVGFRKVADWYLSNDKLKIVISIQDDNKQALYCLVVDDIPMYIGKTKATFKKRMNQYRLGGGGSTNKRNHNKLIKALSNDSTVEVYTLYDQALLHYGEFHVNLKAGLEDSIIWEISPEWNKEGVDKTKQKPI